ncbi:MAG TPA: helix-turn-helix transcriptional regulator [Vineibacter sp.]|nr:helix-turn-helix transcriptional regulator [Vineibacter sp.]
MASLQRIEARRALSEFVRERRMRTKPQDVGLPAGSRRRTPGLRREEVAQLSGVSVTWYTWFEQGRDIQVSAAFLDRVCVALRLDSAERDRLLELAQHQPSSSVPASAPALPPSRAPVAVPSQALALSRHSVVPVRPVYNTSTVVDIHPSIDPESFRINEAIRKVLVNDDEVRPSATLPVEPAPPPPVIKPTRPGIRLGIGLTLLTAFMLVP